MPRLGLHRFPALTNKVALATADVIGFAVALLAATHFFGDLSPGSGTSMLEDGLKAARY